MQIRIQNHGSEGGDAQTTVEVIDPSDGAVTHKAECNFDEQIVVTASSAHSPADIEFGEIEDIPSEAPEPDTETEAENERKVAEQPTPPAEGAEDSADTDETPPAAA